MKTTSTRFGVTPLLAAVLTAAGSALACVVNDCSGFPSCGFPCMATRLNETGCPDVACACPADNFESGDFLGCINLVCSEVERAVVLAFLKGYCDDICNGFVACQEDDALAPLNPNSTITVTTFLAQSSGFPEPSAYPAPEYASGASGGGPGYASTTNSSVTAGDPMSGAASTSSESVATVTVVATATRMPQPAQVTFASGERIVPHLFGLGLILLALAVLQS